MFLATETGIFFTKDGGNNWNKMTNGLPTISFRDIAIQRRENDLVGASFGRGIFILDDISPLREMKASDLALEAKAFSTRPAYRYNYIQEKKQV